MLHPIQSRWFELLVDREKTLEVLDLLAGTGLIELEIDPQSNDPIGMREIQSHIAQYERLVKKYKQYWPEPQIRRKAFDHPPLETLKKAVGLLDQWQLEADPLLARIELLERERGNLYLVLELARAVDERQLDIRLLSGSKQTTRVEIFAIPLSLTENIKTTETISYSVDGTDHRFILLLTLNVRTKETENAFSCESYHRVKVPADLPSGKTDMLEAMSEQLSKIDQTLSVSRKQLESLGQKYKLQGSLNDIALFKWYISAHRCEPTPDQAFCRITGWTIDKNGKVLHSFLEQAGLELPIRFTDPPKNTVAPSVVSNPHWAQPFEIFINLFGQPAGTEVDPSRILAIVIPLIFGYMFPDVGHGGLLVAVALLGKRRWPQIALLVPCGLAAMIFGVVFGEVFGFEGVMDPLLFRAMDQPLVVLTIPVIFGSGLIMFGFVLKAISDYWQGRIARWLAEDAGVIAIYIGILSGIFFSEMLWIAAGGAIWYIVGNLGSSRGQFHTKLPHVIGSLLQTTFELLLNTISFVRVGAFALAHAALSTAVLSVASIQSNPVAHLTLFLLGTLIVVLLEVIVVMAQTTRLVFFEFFSHFFKAEGRIFKPSKVID